MTFGSFDVLTFRCSDFWRSDPLPIIITLYFKWILLHGDTLKWLYCFWWFYVLLDCWNIGCEKTEKIVRKTLITSLCLFFVKNCTHYFQQPDSIWIKFHVFVCREQNKIMSELKTNKAILFNFSIFTILMYILNLYISIPMSQCFYANFFSVFGKCSDYGQTVTANSVFIN